MGAIGRRRVNVLDLPGLPWVLAIAGSEPSPSKLHATVPRFNRHA